MFVLRILGAFLLLVTLSACATAPAHRGVYPVATKGEYLLDSGDTLRITVYGDQTLTNVYRLDDQGEIAFPLVGPIMARGLTTKATAAKIAAALADGYIRKPDVSVEIAEYRPFFIQGAVLTSGKYSYVDGLTVRAAISMAGGFTEVANRDRVLVYRKQGGQIIKGWVDLDFPVYPDDTIVIQERWL